MDLLIIHSGSRRDEAQSLAARLHGKPTFHPLGHPSQWSVHQSEELLAALRAGSHWLFLVDPADYANPELVFAAGYCLAVHERSFYLGTGRVPEGWRSLVTVCEDFAALVAALEAERLRWARHLDQLSAKSELASRGVEVSNTAFVESVMNGDQGSCELFLKAGFSPNLLNKKGVNVLCLAVRAAHLGVVRLLLDRGADINLRSQDRDNSAIMDAAAEGLTDIVAELVRRGADLEGQSRNGQNVLVLAIGKGAQDIAALLFDAGADPFVADKLGMNACQYAQLLGRQDFLARVKARHPEKV